MEKLYILFLCLFLSVFTGYSQAITEDESQNVFDLTLEQLLNIRVEDKSFQLYGYINSNVEKVYNFPDRDSSGFLDQESEAVTWSPVKNFHIYGSQQLSPKIKVFFNLAYGGDDREFVEIRNAYGDFKLHELFQIRVGKIYRRFCLYNEKLDQIPTFIGIEPPEIFDRDHLFVTRTTAFMLHGELEKLNGAFMYSVTLDNGEGGPDKNTFPFGWDVRYRSDEYKLMVGTSGYTSGGNASSTVDFNAGSTKGAVLPWVDKDNFQVYSLFLEKTFGSFLIQSSYTLSPHSITRNKENVLTLVSEGGINRAQRERFLGANASKATTDLTEQDVVSGTTYVSKSFYIRMGYVIRSGIGQIVPYFLMDYMHNPETIQNKQYGGDNEAGLADNGEFIKPSLGLAYRPQPEVAIKFDASLHSQTIDGNRISYPEFRLDFSFAFDAIKAINRR